MKCALNLWRGAQRGAGMLLGFVLMFTFLLMLAWVVDIAQLELFIGNVQSSADAAALAGADQFDMRTPDQVGQDSAGANPTRQESWRNAKEAVFKSLAGSSLRERFGTRFDPSDPTNPTVVCVVPFTGPDSPDLPNWRCREWEFAGKIRVRVDRGLWYERSGVQRFLSLEDSNPPANVCTTLQADSGVPATRYFPRRCAATPLPAPGEPPGGLPYWVPNAVRVKIVLNRLPTFFGRLSVIGIRDFTNLGTRETVASREILVETTGTVDPW